MQHAAPHPGAQAARIFFFTRFKDNFAELRAPQPVGDFQLAAQLLNGGIVCFNPTEAGVERDGCQLEAGRIKAAQSAHACEQGDAVLPAGYADGDAVPFCYHMIAIYGASHLAE